jgi:hypothetical protein
VDNAAYPQRSRSSSSDFGGGGSGKGEKGFSRGGAGAGSGAMKRSGKAAARGSAVRGSGKGADAGRGTAEGRGGRRASFDWSEAMRRMGKVAWEPLRIKSGVGSDLGRTGCGQRISCGAVSPPAPEAAARPFFTSWEDVAAQL